MEKDKIMLYKTAIFHKILPKPTLQAWGIQSFALDCI